MKTRRPTVDLAARACGLRASLQPEGLDADQPYTRIARTHRDASDVDAPFLGRLDACGAESTSEGPVRLAHARNSWEANSELPSCLRRRTPLREVALSLELRRARERPALVGRGSCVRVPDQLAARGRAGSRARTGYVRGIGTLSLAPVASETSGTRICGLGQHDHGPRRSSEIRPVE